MQEKENEDDEVKRKKDGQVSQEVRCTKSVLTLSVRTVGTGMDIHVQEKENEDDEEERMKEEGQVSKEARCTKSVCAEKGGSAQT